MLASLHFKHDSWNRLPEDTVTTTSLNIFKNKPDRSLVGKFRAKIIKFSLKNLKACLASAGYWSRWHLVNVVNI